METDADAQPGRLRAFLNGALTVLPITIAVIPWGILAGSYALNVGLSAVESQAMSAIIFGGSVQLAALGMLNAGAGLVSILITTALITSRHALYSMTMRSQLSVLPLRWRLGLGFLLTDELFAIAAPGQQPHFDRWHALGGGLTFYIGWNVATLMGIIAGQSIPNLADRGLDFAIAATFIALVVPAIKKPSTVYCVLTSLLVAVICAVFAVQAGLLIAALSGMLVGYWSARLSGEKS